MARRFSGAASSGGVIKFTGFPRSVQKTYVAWIYAEGAGGQGAGRLFESTGASAGEVVRMSATNFFYDSPWSTTKGSWSISYSTRNVYTHFALTYDGGSTSNAPLIYIDGVSQTVTPQQTPVGTFDSANCTFYLGNRDIVDLTFQGRIADFASFTRILTPAEIMTIARNGLDGFLPRVYLSLAGPRASLEMDVSGHNNHGRVIDTATSNVTTALDPPRVQRSRWRPTAPQGELFFPTPTPLFGLPSSMVVPIITVQQW